MISSPACTDRKSSTYYQPVLTGITISASKEMMSLVNGRSRLSLTLSKLLLSKVALCLYSLARATQKHPEYKGPSLGPKFATKNERNFTDEQIRKGRDGVIGLQSGTNKGASQVGNDENIKL